MKKLILLVVISIISGKVSPNPAPPQKKSASYQIPEELENQAELKQFEFRNGILITEEKEILPKSDDDESYVTYRLPNNTRPIRYDLWVKTDVEKEIFRFEGEVKIEIEALESTDYVTLQYRHIEIDQVDIWDVLGTEPVAEYLEFSYLEPKTHEFLKINLNKTVNPGEKFALNILYHGNLHEPEDNGFYKAYYVDANNKTIWYATTKFEPHHARHLMPCYDEPHIRAQIGLKVLHTKSYHTYSNMPVKSITPQNGGYVTTEFEDTPPMQTYLLAFLVSAFKFVSNNDTSIEQRIFAKPQSIDDGEADYAAEISDGILKKFEELLKVPYPLPKLDHVAITQFPSGAMENFGFISYREAGLLLFKSYTPAQVESNRRYIARLIAHETAHQWFGNTVAPQWWTHLWLNEGFATVYEYLIPHILYPELGFYELFRTSCVQSSLRNDIPSSASSVPMSYYVEEPTAIRGRFNFISYQKAGTVLMMFLEALGTDIFHKGLENYLNENHFGVGDPSKLFAGIQNAYGNGLNIEALMSSWTTQAGYPILRVERFGDKLKFSQKRYPTGDSEPFAIPLTYATKSNPDFEKKIVSTWITEKEQEVNVIEFNLGESDWIIFNNQQIGFYRLDYSEDLWENILDGLRNNREKIHLINRRILQEELNIGISVSKSISASIMFKILNSLENEDNYLVWNDANVNFQFLNRTLFNKNIYDNYMQFLQELTNSVIERIGYEATDLEPTEITQLRLRVKTLNCDAFNYDCMQHEHTKLINYHQNENENPAPDFCLGFRLAEKDIYDHYLTELTSNSSLKNRNLIARTIHCSLNKDFLGVLIVAVEDETNILTTDERTNIINFMLVSSSISFNVAFDYIQRNVEKIKSFRNQLIAAVNTQEIFDELKLMLTKAVSDGILTQPESNEIQAAINEKLNWHEKYSEEVENYLKDFKPITTESSTTPTTAAGSSENPTTTPKPTEAIESTTLAANSVVVSLYLIIAVVVSTYFVQ